MEKHEIIDIIQDCLSSVKGLCSIVTLIEDLPERVSVRDRENTCYVLKNELERTEDLMQNLLDTLKVE